MFKKNNHIVHPFSAPSDQINANLKRSHLRRNCCFVYLQHYDEHYIGGKMAGKLMRGKNTVTKLVSNPFTPPCHQVSLELATDLWGGGLWIIARALPAPTVI